ncbi:hypothetical protein GBAR_LOCUS30578, partial [Geodia barretti]
METLVKELPKELTQDLQELPNLLEELGNLSAFQLYPKRVQKSALIDVLGDKSPLVEVIMERLKANTAPPSTVDKLLSYTLAPSQSQNISYGTFINVAEAILKPTKPFGDESSVRNFFFSKMHSLKDAPLPETEISSVQAMLD